MSVAVMKGVGQFLSHKKNRERDPVWSCARDWTHCSWSGQLRTSQASSLMQSPTSTQQSHLLQTFINSSKNLLGLPRSGKIGWSKACLTLSGSPSPLRKPSSEHSAPSCQCALCTGNSSAMMAMVMFAAFISCFASFFASLVSSSLRRFLYLVCPFSVNVNVTADSGSGVVEMFWRAVTT